MRELSTEAENPTTSTDDGGPSAESAQALKSVWEQMLIEGMDGHPGAGQISASETSTGGGGGGGGGGFQDKIKQAVNKLKESESNLQVNYNFPPCFKASLTNYLQ